VISPVLANWTLDGLQRLLAERFANTPQQRKNKVHLVRYEPENFLTFLRVSGCERSPYTNFPMESGPMRLFSRRCLASESELCLSGLHLNPG
jgi:hypothetical protein